MTWRGWAHIRYVCNVIPGLAPDFRNLQLSVLAFNILQVNFAIWKLGESATAKVAPE